MNSIILLIQLLTSRVPPPHLADVRAAGDGGAGGGAAGRLRHHLRALPRLRPSPPRQSRHLHLLQVSI